MNWLDKCKNIKAVVFDIDGTLTDGRLGYGNGDSVIKFFSIKDGMAFNFCRKAGLKTAALTARKDMANTRRMQELHADFIQDDCSDKADGLRQLCRTMDLSPEDCMVLGDDLFDMPAMAICGLSVAVADAAAEVRQCADWTTEATGGHGALREAVERLLKIRGQWDAITQPFIDLFPKTR